MSKKNRRRTLMWQTPLSAGLIAALVYGIWYLIVGPVLTNTAALWAALVSGFIIGLCFEIADEFGFELGDVIKLIFSFLRSLWQKVWRWIVAVCK